MKNILIKNERFVYYHEFDKSFTLLCIQYFTSQETQVLTSTYIANLRGLIQLPYNFLGFSPNSSL